MLVTESIPSDKSMEGEKKKKKKSIIVTGRGDSQGCETSKVPHFLDNRFTDGGKVVRFTRWPSYTPKKIPHTHIC
jgi:hypothetical protein